MRQKVFIGGYEMISSLGFNAHDHQKAFEQNKSGITVKDFDFGAQPVSGIDEFLFNQLCEKLDIPDDFSKVEKLITATISQLVTMNKIETLAIPLFIASTKGNINRLNASSDYNHVHLINSGNRIKDYFNIASPPTIICNACTSGLHALIMASRLIETGAIDQALVSGVDIISDFTLRGFRALHAMSSEPCRPYDESRAGITIGEGAATIWLTTDRNKAKAQILGGATSNDANHISGPSRTGAGLQQAVRDALRAGEHPTIDFINAHGTATNFNDEMECKAFAALGLSELPTMSNKGYWGHTLGAAGVIETAAVCISLEEQRVYKTIGYENHGVSLPLNIVQKNENKSIKHALKTSSGFGGSNAAVILKHIKESE